jgi:TRAP-type uncharacterized transport system fused permease subunit
LVAETESGARNPTGAIPKKNLFRAVDLDPVSAVVCLPPAVPFQFFVLNDTEARAIHLAFAIFLSYTAYPTSNRPRGLHPVQDWVMALVAAFCASYLFWFYAELADRPGPTQMDLIVSVVGLIMLLEATRRALGPPLMVVATFSSSTPSSAPICLL